MSKGSANVRAARYALSRIERQWPVLSDAIASFEHHIQEVSEKDGIPDDLRTRLEGGMETWRSKVETVQAAMNVILAHADHMFKATSRREEQ